MLERTARSLFPIAMLMATATAIPHALDAQASAAALFLLQPVGARSVGHGEATVADTLLGTEALWWNPAGMARIRKRELAVHYGQAFFAKTNLIAAAIPSKALGTISVAGFLQSYDRTEARNEDGSLDGLLSSNYYMLAAAYATPFAKGLSAGITGKFVRISIACDGCTSTTIKDSKGSTGAVDFGMQYVVPVKFPLTLGGSIRNLGPKLRTNDVEQAEPLPRITQVGARARLPIAELTKRQAVVEIMADAFQSPAYKSMSFRAGAELTYKELYTIRAGYKALSEDDGLERGFTAGIGLRYNAWQFDLARRFDQSSSFDETGKPTFVSLRYVF